MALRRIVAPAETPVTLAEAKAHLRMIHANDDAIITLYLEAAVANLDGKAGLLGRSLVTQTWELVYDTFPCGPIELPLGPLQSIVSVKYFDVDGAEQTLDPAGYAVDTASDPGWLSPVDSWPATYAMVNAVVIRFVAGYGAATAVPAAIKAGILLMVADMYENREASVIGVTRVDNPAVDRLLFPYRRLTP
jgi:uncharacterized phiE125 gp8 family phage protein